MLSQLHNPYASVQQTPTLDIQIEIESANPVEVPMNSFQPCRVLTSQLQGIDPLVTSTQNGKDIYSRVIHVTGNHLQSCTECTM